MPRANAFLNTWNSEEVRARYDDHVIGFLTNINGKTQLNATRVALAFRKLVLEDGADAHSPDTLAQARRICDKYTNPVIPFETISWVTFTMMLSELGKKKELADLLEYADTNLQPTWEHGGLYYPRNDRLLDDDSNMVHMEPHSGNAGIGYARLNVEDGQKIMWEKPWTRQILASRPFVDKVSFADGVDFLRGVWDPVARAMIITLKSWSGDSRAVTLRINNLPKGDWAVYIQGMLNSTVKDAETIDLVQVVGATEVDMIVAGI